MNYGRIPLFPDDNSSGEYMRMPLFGEGRRCAANGNCQTVRICNPVCPGEYADVELCVDACGNLSICVRRPPQDCCDRRKRCRSRC